MSVGCIAQLNIYVFRYLKKIKFDSSRPSGANVRL